MTQTSANRFPITWDLDSLFPRPETSEFKQIVEQFKVELDQLANDSEKLPALANEYASAWGDFFERVEKVFIRATDLSAFIACHGAADAENKVFQQMEASLAATGPQRNQVFTNIELAFRGLTDEAIDTFASADSRLKQVKFFLEDCRANAQFRLPKDQELLAAELGVDGLHAWGRFYDRVSGELRVELMEKGEVVRKSPGQVRMDMLDRGIRENNFYATEKAWKKVGDSCADALNHIAGTRLSRYRRLGTQDHLDAPLRFNRMSRETLNVMWDVISQRKKTLLKFFKRKSELLGISQMSWFDQLAPLPQASQGTSSGLGWDEACDKIINAFSEFSDELGQFAKMTVEDRWTEAEDRSGKRQGGFCTGFPGSQQSRIYMTFTGSADSMSTLAHEIGHAYHSHVLREQPFLLQDYPMNLAETASTFAEAVLGEKRLVAAQTAPEKLGILNNMLADSVAFLMNIHARFLFEDQFHVQRKNGELTSDQLTELMLKAQKEAYCDAFDVWSEAFWINKLHFYISSIPFYNFPYTFGYLLSLGVYSTAKDFGNDFPQKYRELLIATGNHTAEDAVKSTLGFDLTQPDFWNRSIDIIDQRIELFLETSQQVESVS